MRSEELVAKVYGVESGESGELWDPASGHGMAGSGTLFVVGPS
jgi:hypothetical protein